MSKHTPTPWEVHIRKDGGNWDYQIRTVEPHNPAGRLGKHIATVNAQMQARGEDNAALIVRAVNAHADLLAACKALLAADWDSGRWEAACREAEAAIAKAEGEPTRETDCAACGDATDGTIVTTDGRFICAACDEAEGGAA